MKIRDQKKRVAFLEEENERLKKTRRCATRRDRCFVREAYRTSPQGAVPLQKHQSSAERTMNQLHHSEEIANEELAQAVRARDSIMSQPTHRVFFGFVRGAHRHTPAGDHSPKKLGRAGDHEIQHTQAAHRMTICVTICDKECAHRNFGGSPPPRCAGKREK